MKIIEFSNIKTQPDTHEIWTRDLLRITKLRYLLLHSVIMHKRVAKHILKKNWRIAIAKYWEWCMVYIRCVLNCNTHTALQLLRSVLKRESLLPKIESGVWCIYDACWIQYTHTALQHWRLSVIFFTLKRDTLCILCIFCMSDTWKFKLMIHCSLWVNPC